MQNGSRNRVVGLLHGRANRRRAIAISAEQENPHPECDLPSTALTWLHVPAENCPRLGQPRRKERGARLRAPPSPCRVPLGQLPHPWTAQAHGHQSFLKSFRGAASSRFAIRAMSIDTWRSDRSTPKLCRSACRHVDPAPQPASAPTPVTSGSGRPASGPNFSISSINAIDVLLLNAATI